MSAEPEKFVELFNHPSVEAMYALTPTEFEHFVAYVLRRAGYDVKVVGPHWLRGVDLEMRLPGSSHIVGGVECKRFQPGEFVPAHVVTHLKGAAAVSNPGAKPYVITTSDFHENAYKIAEVGKHAYLINGSQLVRYITYIRGSRYDDNDTITSLSPEFFAGRDGADFHPVGGAKILTIANNKGGVGKTTTAFYLGAELARQGKRVLLIDLDGQANLTERCFPNRFSDYSDGNGHFPNVVQYFSGQQALHELITSTSKERLSIIASDPFLRLRDIGGSGRPDVELQFARDVENLRILSLPPFEGVPDWIIIDTPPAMSVFTRAGLAAAHYVLAPVRPRPASVLGTVIMLNTLRTMNALTGNGTAFMGAVVTHWDELKVSENYENLFIRPRLRDYGGDIFRTKIPIDNQLEFLEPGAKIHGAKAYEALAMEVMRDVEHKKGISSQQETISYANTLRREE